MELASNEQYDDKDEVNGDKSDKENTDDNLEYDDSEIEEDEETEIIFQRFLKNHEKKENELERKLNEENLAAKIQQFKFVSDKRPSVH